MSPLSTTSFQRAVRARPSLISLPVDLKLSVRKANGELEINLQRLPKHIALPDIAVDARIPRRLHQICLPDAASMPELVRANIEELKAMHPHWGYRLFDAAGAERFILDTYGRGILEVYRALDPAYPAARADFLRYLVCYAEGGVYLDLKSRTARPFDEILQDDDQFLLNQWNEYQNVTDRPSPHKELWSVPGGEYTIWCIAAAPGHPFLRAVLERCIENIRRYQPIRHGVGQYGILRLTGPVMFTSVVHPIREKHPHRMVMLDPDEKMRWTIYDDFAQHRGTHGRHYSELTLPLVTGSRFGRLLAQAVFGYLLPGIRRIAQGIRRRLPLTRP